jgi:hypothetical protein
MKREREREREIKKSSRHRKAPRAFSLKHKLRSVERTFVFVDTRGSNPPELPRLAEPREFVDLSTGVTKVPIENSQEAPRARARALVTPRMQLSRSQHAQFPTQPRSARVSAEPSHRSFHRNAPFRARGTLDGTRVDRVTETIACHAHRGIFHSVAAAIYFTRNRDRYFRRRLTRVFSACSAKATAEKRARARFFRTTRNAHIHETTIYFSGTVTRSFPIKTIKLCQQMHRAYIFHSNFR